MTGIQVILDNLRKNQRKMDDLMDDMGFTRDYGFYQIERNKYHIELLNQHVRWIEKVYPETSS